MKNTTKHTGLGGLLLAAVGCVGPVQIAPLPYAHPANPETPAGVLSPLATGLGGKHNKVDGESHQMTGHGKHAASDAKPAGKYHCPMHAGVRSDTPGRCPVCGMKLVARTDGTEQHEGQHEE